MTNNIPSRYVANFTNERLTIIADALLEQCYNTDDDLKSNYDDGYSIGCTRFARQKNCLLDMPSEYSWLSIIDGSNSLVMAINGEPFRFTNDDHLSPKKKSALEISEKEAKQINSAGVQGQLRFNDPNFDVNYPVKWRFYVDISHNVEDGGREYEIFFVGLNFVNKPCCIWELSKYKTSFMSSTDDKKPERVKTERAKTTLPTNPSKRDKDINEE